MMSSIFHRLDELERVQQEILVQLNGTEIPESDGNARSATHSHEMHPKVTYSELVVDDVPNNDTLVERVARVIAAESSFESHWEDWQIEARAAILEIADALERANEIWSDAVVQKNAAAWLRSQVEP